MTSPPAEAQLSLRSLVPGLADAEAEALHNQAARDNFIDQRLDVWVRGQAHHHSACEALRMHHLHMQQTDEHVA